MLPRELQPAQFSAYPPQAGKLVAAHLEVLRELPLSFVPGLLREVIEYDYKFPAERAAVDGELTTLGGLSPSERTDWFHGFEQFDLPAQLEHFDWINSPAQFTEKLSAYLWSTHQLDAYRRTAEEYGTRLRSSIHADPLPVARLGITVIGQGVAEYDELLFKNLRPHGTYFNQIRPENGLEALLDVAAARAKSHPVPYGHWYVDGGSELHRGEGLTRISYQSIEPLRTSLLKYMQGRIGRPGMGPEELRTDLARLTPSDLAMNRSLDPVLSRFQLKILTEGSGTQIFSTTFAQWTTREVLRRAQPLTLLVRFAPRQRQRPMNELLSDTRSDSQVDPVGSLVDADMAAYYQWINQQRLTGDNRAAFLVWFEGHAQALVVAPTLPRGTTSNSALDLKQLVALAAG
ncbi:MAG: hypothetical protein WCC26_00870 [Terracidiphilus sp.]